MFASCLLDISGCTANPVSLSVTTGESVNFNAMVTHVQGGSCGFVQEITRVKLTKINEAFSSTDQTLLSCPTNNPTCAGDRLSLDRGRDPGIQFVFTLSSATADDAGLYEVTVELRDPDIGSQPRIMKRFHLEGTVIYYENL